MRRIDNYLKTNPPIRLATVGYFLRDGKILLGFRKRVSNNLGLHIYSGIGGKTRAGETRDDALVREVREEVSVTITRWQFIGQVQYLFPDESKNQDVSIAVITQWEGEPAETEDMRPQWFHYNRLPSLMWPDAKYTLPLVLTIKPGKEFSGAFLYDERGEIAEYRLAS